MEQYINKADIAAEIKRRIQFFTEESGNSNSDIVIALFGLKSFLDTLEVKEVDLNREIEKEIETRWRGEYLFTTKFKESAKHFFELGLKAQKGE